jgi:hypothetical protein
MKFRSIFNNPGIMAAKIALFGLLLVFTTNLYAAEPTLSEVYQAAQAGHLQEAEAMMTQVLNAHPDSAKAHFVKAEILAKEGRIAEARVEFSNAERLQPNLLFAKPVAIDMLKRKLGLISQSTSVTTPQQSGEQSGISNTSLIWGILIVVAIVVWFIVRSRTRPAYPNANNYGANPAAPNGGYGPGYYPPQGGVQGGGIGSGIVGGLATGAAVGAGIVAGEVLMHRMLDDNHPNDNHLNTGNYVPDTNQHPTDNFDMGGNDFGVTDNSSWDDSSSDNNDSSDWT